MLREWSAEPSSVGYRCLGRGPPHTSPLGVPVLSKCIRSVAVLALALGMFTLDAGSLTPVSAEEPGSATLTSQLLPGWNMVAWLGPEAPVSELFAALPALRQVSAWDSDEQRYRRALRTSTPRDGLTRLTAGMGLWLRVGGDEPVEWTRPLSEGHVLLSLRSGLNLVGWTGRDGESFAESAGRAGDALVLASRWNAETQSYELFGPPAKGSLRLNRGDAIWVELNDDARWWQSATFEFASDIPADQQVAIRDEMLRVVEFFEERYAIEPAQLSVAVGVEAAGETGATARRVAISSSAAESRAIADTLAREYFHLVRQDLAGGSDSPAWMTAGASGYAVGAYRQARGETTAPRLHAERWLDLLYTATPALPELEAGHLASRRRRGCGQPGRAGRGVAGRTGRGACALRVPAATACLGELGGGVRGGLRHRGRRLLRGVRSAPREARTAGVRSIRRPD